MKPDQLTGQNAQKDNPMKNTFTAKIALIIIVISMSLTACGNNSGYTLISKDQGNVSIAYNTAQCAASAGSNFVQAAKCITK